MDYNNIVKLFNDGVSDSGILFILVLIDTTLALTYCLKIKRPILSETMLSGLLRNVILCFMPAAIAWLSVERPRSDDVYGVIAAVLTIYIGYAVIQSILAYTTLWGVKYPDWVNSWLKDEITHKEQKGSDKNEQDNK